MRGYVFVAIFALLLPIAYASTLVYLETEDLVKRSEAIIRGKVRDIESRYNEERTKIFTYTIVEVSETIKGNVPPVITIETYGGRVGDINMKVPGMPEFTKGEEVLLFLKKSENLWHITGMIQGKFRIERDEEGKEFLVNDFRGISFKKVKADKKLEDMRIEDVPNRIKYQEFISKIKEIVNKK